MILEIIHDIEQSTTHKASKHNTSCSWTMETREKLRQLTQTRTRRWLQAASTEVTGNGSWTPQEEEDAAEQTSQTQSRQKDKKCEPTKSAMNHSYTTSVVYRGNLKVELCKNYILVWPIFYVPLCKNYILVRPGPARRNITF